MQTETPVPPPESDSASANDTETTKAAVELKVLIEQIREQVQNVE